MKIGLIFSPFSHRKFEEDLPAVSQEFGVYPPLGLAYAASILENAGHKVKIIDANALKLSKEETLRQIKRFKPDMLGFMLTTYMFRLTLDWIKFFKQQMNLPIIVGNINMELYPKETLYHKEIDYGIIGYALKSLPLLIKAIENGFDLSKIEGIAYKKDKKIIIQPPKNLEEVYNKLPYPARHLLPNDSYYQFISQRKNFTIILTTRGCPSQCNFCYVRHIPYQERSLKNTMGEILECYEKYKVREIDFFEPSLTINKKRTAILCNKIIEQKLDLHWSCRARADQVDNELLSLMSKAGCKRIYYGIESGCQEILDKDKKGITLKKIEDAIKLTKENNIKSLGFFMIGQVGDTKQTVLKTIEFAKKLPLDYIQVGRTIPKPGAYLDYLMQKHTGYDYWRNYILGIVEEKRIPTPWTSLSEEEKFDLARRFYKEFYFRPSYIFKNLLKVKSKHEFVRYARAALDILKKKSLEHEI